MIDGFQHNEGGLDTADTPLKTKLRFRKESSMFCVLFDSVQENHFINLTKGRKQCYISTIIFIVCFVPLPLNKGRVVPTFRDLQTEDLSKNSLQSSNKTFHSARPATRTCSHMFVINENTRTPL